jgi:uncharacterized SAM-binding protein YcdF (DUF218 family)
MTTLIILLLLVIAVSLFAFKSIKSGKIAIIITTIFFLLTGTGVFSFFLLNKLESFPVLAHPDWGKHNAIILLGAGAVKLPGENTVFPTMMAYSRIYETARLYSSCKKTNAECIIIISGGDALSVGKSEAAVYQNALDAIGIKDSDIILEANSMNTYKNAELTSAILKSKQFDQVFLVTSGIHMKRALLYFSHFGIQATPSVSDYIPPKIYNFPSGYNFAITDFALHEYIGIMRFYIYNYLGLNAKSTAPGTV